MSGVNGVSGPGGSGGPKAPSPELTTRLRDRLVTLCKVASPSRNERQIADLLTAEFEALGASIREDDAAVAVKGNAGNLIAELPGERPGRVVLTAHMDTVPLTPGQPLEPVVEGSIVRASGKQILGADDKAGVTVVLELMQRAAALPAAQRPTLLAVITVCEELGLKGARHLDVARLNADYAYSFDGEVPVGELITSAVFKEDLTLQVTGRAAHAALEPERGVHAILAAARVVDAFPMGRVAPDQVANIGAVQGGGPTNVVPAEVTLRGEARAFSEERLEELMATIRAGSEAAAATVGASVRLQRERLYDGYRIEDDATPIARLRTGAEPLGISVTSVASIGGSDTSILNQKGLPTVNVGVGMNEIHSVNEWIDAAGLARVVEWVGAALF
ncbi:MAG: M20/M25/M40 family metallo-hydrolase [Trueperaceae bacterium]